jgi:hypothetical protein
MGRQEEIIEQEKNFTKGVEQLPTCSDVKGLPGLHTE